MQKLCEEAEECSGLWLRKNQRERKKQESKSTGHLLLWLGNYVLTH